MNENNPPNDPKSAKGSKRGVPYGKSSGRDRVNPALDKKQQRAMQASRAVLKVENFPPAMARSFRPLAPELIEKITERIQKEVAAFAGPPQGRRHQLIHLAVEGAVTYFLDVLENRPSPASDVHELFRRMGYAEAIDANDLDAMRAAYHVATRDSWEAIRRFVRATNLPPEVLAVLIDAILMYIEQLIAQVTVGYLSALQGVDRPSHEARRRLLAGLLSGRPFDQLKDHATEANWLPPEDVVVLTASLDGPGHLPPMPKHGPEVLVGLRRQRLTMVGSTDEIRRLAAELLPVKGIAQVAVSWPVEMEQLRDAYRWTFRALDLFDLGMIQREGVIYCSEHRDILWLYADLSLSRHSCEELLAPLEGQKPHHRLMLAETLLLWLQTRESAPQLAERMDVHGQTVRHRLRKLKLLFGDELTDPHRTLAMLSALELTIPRWRTALRNSKRKKPE